MNIEQKNILAIPSKDRMNDESVDLLAQAGVDIQIPGRQLTTELELPDTGRFTVALLRPRDIVKLVSRGTISAGIVGLDVAEEFNTGCLRSERVDVALLLGIGKCRLSFATPADSNLQTEVDLVKAAISGITIDEIEGLSRSLRLATSFPYLTQRFFGQEKSKEIGYSLWRGIDIEELGGSVEAAPILGMADAIVDLVETGTTLEQNGSLREIATVIQSEGVLITRRLFGEPEPFALAVQQRLSAALGR
jgi:ATP phosphoribosyltransferase